MTGVQALTAPDPHAVELPPVDWAKVVERTNANIDELKARAAKIGDGVTSEQQALFNEIARCYPNCRWGENREMLVEDAVIKPPYDSSSITGPPKLVERLLLVCTPTRHSHPQAEAAQTEEHALAFLRSWTNSSSTEPRAPQHSESMKREQQASKQKRTSIHPHATTNKKQTAKNPPKASKACV